MTALLAALSVCAGGAALAIALAGGRASAETVNAENGVHAVPSGQVEGATLARLDAPQRLLTPVPVAAPAPLLTPAPIAAPAPLAVPALPDAAPAAAVQEVADAEVGPEESAVYRRAAQPVAEPAVASGQDASAKLIKVSNSVAAPPSSIGQHVAFPRRSTEAASAFDGYMHAVAAIDAAFKSGQGVAAALRRASAYDPHQLEEGMIAYGAMAAMQSPGFVYGVMDAAQDPRARRELVEALMADPESAARLPGAAEASAMAAGAILTEARPVVDNGRAIKQASYDVQHQGWSIAKAADQPARLAAAKAASQVRLSVRDGDVARLLTQVSALGGAGGRAPSASSPVVAHSLALAALAILDGTEGSDEDRLDQVVNERVSAECLKMAKLNLFQCLSVAGPEYEDVYCLGQHAVLDTGQCVAGGAAPAQTVLISEAPRMSPPPQ